MAEVEWVNLKAYELRDLAVRGAMVIVPVGSTEQHGPHLPVQVDALLAGEVSRRAARRAWDTAPVVVMPPVWTGLAEHHMSLGGTITLDYATFAALLGDICHSIARHGFGRILILNGHGGNITGLNVLTGELAQELDAIVAMACYWTLDAAAEAFADILEVQTNVRHAGEAETSMLLALRPDLVDMEAAARIDLADGGVECARRCLPLAADRPLDRVGGDRRPRRRHGREGRAPARRRRAGRCRHHPRRGAVGGSPPPDRRLRAAAAPRSSGGDGGAGEGRDGGPVARANGRGGRHPRPGHGEDVAER